MKSTNKSALYWREWQELAQPLTVAIGRMRQAADKIGKPDPRVLFVLEKLSGIERSLKALSQVRWLKETAEETAWELEHCPVKGNPYQRCISCECRREGPGAYASRDPHHHVTMSLLRSAPETATGR